MARALAVVALSAVCFGVALPPAAAQQQKTEELSRVLARLSQSSATVKLLVLSGDTLTASPLLYDPLRRVVVLSESSAQAKAELELMQIRLILERVSKRGPLWGVYIGALAGFTGAVLVYGDRELDVLFYAGAGAVAGGFAGGLVHQRPDEEFAQVWP